MSNLLDPFDEIEKPEHYTKGRIYEPKDVIRSWGLNFNTGSAVKYISRAGRKDDRNTDLKKAVQFLAFETEAINNGYSVPKVTPGWTPQWLDPYRAGEDWELNSNLATALNAICMASMTENSTKYEQLLDTASLYLEKEITR